MIHVTIWIIIIEAKQLCNSQNKSYFISILLTASQRCDGLNSHTPVRFHSLGWIKVGHLPHSGQGEVILRKLRWEYESNIKCWIIHWMSGRGAHTKNIPSHPVVYHLYTWELYSQVSSLYCNALINSIHLSRYLISNYLSIYPV